MRDLFITQPESRDLIHEVSQSVTRSAVLLLVVPFLLSIYLLGASKPVQYLTPVIWISLPVLFICWLVFLGTWNDFVGPLLYIQSPDMFTVSIGLAGFRSIMRSRWDLLMAAATAMTVPVVALFFAAQRYFFESGGITLTGLK